MDAVRYTTLIISALTLVAMPACEEDGSSSEGGNGGGGGSLEPSVDESKPIDELDESEEQELCEEAGRYAASQIEPIRDELGCMTVALIAGVGLGGDFDSAGCQQAYDDCLANPPEALPGEMTTCDFSQSGECDATVGDYVACFEESIAITRSLVDSFSCDAEGGGISEPADSPACDALNEKCPGLAGGG